MARLLPQQYCALMRPHLDQVGEVAGILGGDVSRPVHAEQEAIRATLRGEGQGRWNEPTCTLHLLCHMHCHPVTASASH